MKDGANLLQSCLSLGFDVPYFCWHPAMHSVGACRQCAVKLFKDKNDTKGKIVMSCMTPVADGMRLSIDDSEVKKFRASVIEWLMLNHPHDCPVCDEGGECHLQDMTLLTGHVYRRTTLKKRTHTNQHLGPFVNHEMNRCIQCYRCVRFYKDYAGGRDLDVFGCHDHVYFGRSSDGVLESEFSGNLVEVCPTGVFTDKTLKQHYTRKWDLQAAPSICAHCSLGCNTIPGERYGTLRRIRNRYNESVNGYFLCDRGRYGYEFANGDKRIREPSTGQTKTTAQAALHEIKQRICGGPAIGQSAGGAIIGIGSPRASLESNYALRELVGAENFYHGVADVVFEMMTEAVRIIKEGPAPAASLEDARQADAVLVLGEDVPNTAPMLALALRQAARNAPLAKLAKLKIPHWDDAAARNALQNEKGPFFIASFTGTRLDDLASEKTFKGGPDDIARLGFLIAHELDQTSPDVPGVVEDQKNLAGRIAGALKNSKKPLIVCGTGAMSVHIIRAAANVAWALKRAGLEAKIAFSLPECNGMGLALMDFPSGKPVSNALARVRAGGARAAIVIESELDESIGHEGAREIMSLPVSIAIDCVSTRTAQMAGIKLPAASFAECQGTLVNNEARAQRFYKVMQPDKNIRETFKWISGIMAALEIKTECSWTGADSLAADMAQNMPQFAPLLDKACFPPADLRIAGMKIPRQPHRYSGRTAMHTDMGMVEPKPPTDMDSALSFSMEGFFEASKKQKEQIPPALLTHYWAPFWNSVQALNKFQSEIGGPLIGGEAGKRLIESRFERDYFKDVPSGEKDKKILAVPLYHVFGSEKLSMMAPAVASLAPGGGGPFLAVSTQTLKGLRTGPSNLSEDDKLELEIDGAVFGFKTKLDEDMPEGLVGVFIPRYISSEKISGDYSRFLFMLPAEVRVKAERK